jgi:HEPN domain-containing protein
MTPHHEEALRFLRLADRDIDVLRHIKDLQDVHISMVCFHAQQAVEKSLKAVLFKRQIDFSRTHDLERLAEMLAAEGVILPCTLEELHRLNPYAVTFRYDDKEIKLLTRDQAASIVDRVRRWAAEQVGI